MRTAFLKFYWRDDRRVRPGRDSAQDGEEETFNLQFRKRRREALLISLEVERWTFSSLPHKTNV